MLITVGIMRDGQKRGVVANVDGTLNAKEAFATKSNVCLTMILKYINFIYIRARTCINTIKLHSKEINFFFE